MFNIPILTILDEIKEDDHTLLDRVIQHLYVEKKVLPRTISILLGLSETIVYQRISKEDKKAKKKATETEVLKRYEKGSHPKEIAYDMKLSMDKVYRILRRSKQTVFSAVENTKLTE